MPSRRRRTPQEKNRLSFAKDRRNDYGQNDKASRKIIPRRKKLANRTVRRGDRQDLEQDADRAEETLISRLKRRWQKSADLPLGEHVARQKRRRIESVNARKIRREKKSP